MVRKNMSFEEKGAAMGHNKPSDKSKMEYTKKFMEIEREIQGLKDDQKEILNNAKDEGHLKGGIRKAAKTLLSSQEQVQAKKEVEREAHYIVQLFANKDGQFSFLKEGAESEAA